MTTSKLHRNAVTSTKVKNNTLKGRDIDERTLGAVPAARHAESAINANAAIRAGSANTAGNAESLQGHGAADFVSAGEYKQVLVKLQAGDEREVVRNGPVSVYARCATVGPNDELRMFAKTDVNGALLLASWGDELGHARRGARRVRAARAAVFLDGRNANDVDHYDDNYLIAPTGQTIAWECEAELLGFNLLGARCLIAGTVHLYDLG